MAVNLHQDNSIDIRNVHNDCFLIYRQILSQITMSLNQTQAWHHTKIISVASVRQTDWQNAQIVAINNAATLLNQPHKIRD